MFCQSTALTHHRTSAYPYPDLAATLRLWRAHLDALGGRLPGGVGPGAAIVLVRAIHSTG